MHADSKWLSSFRDAAGCVLPRRSGKKGAAAIDQKIMLRIIADVRGVAESGGASTASPPWLDVLTPVPAAGATN